MKGTKKLVISELQHVRMLKYEGWADVETVVSRGANVSEGGAYWS
jgi:hypothetical protein